MTNPLMSSRWTEGGREDKRVWPEENLRIRDHSASQCIATAVLGKQCGVRGGEGRGGEGRGGITVTCTSDF